MTVQERTKLNDVIRSIHALEEDLMVYERRYGLLSETFYKAYQFGEEPEDETWVLDWSGWAGAYKSWLFLKQHYQDLIKKLQKETRTLTELVRAAI